MKKSLCILLVLVLLCTPILLVACNETEDVPAVEKHKVIIICNLKVRVEIEVEHGGIIGDFTTYTGIDSVFVARWNYYTDNQHTREWDLFRDKVYTDMTLYGKSIPLI